MPRKARRVTQKVVELHLFYGPQDGAIERVSADQLTLGKVVELDLPAIGRGFHAYISLAEWSGIGDSLKLYYRGHAA